MLPFSPEQILDDSARGVRWVALGPQKLVARAYGVKCVARLLCARFNTQPRVTGRSGAAIHSLQDPGYRRDPGRPATAIANKL